MAGRRDACVGTTLRVHSTFPERLKGHVAGEAGKWGSFHPSAGDEGFFGAVQPSQPGQSRQPGKPGKLHQPCVLSSSVGMFHVSTFRRVASWSHADAPSTGLTRNAISSWHGGSAVRVSLELGGVRTRIDIETTLRDRVQKQPVGDLVGGGGIGRESRP